MAGFLQDNFWFSNSGGSLEIGKSLRFRGTQYLTGPAPVSTTSTLATFSTWVKRGDSGEANGYTMFGSQTSVNSAISIDFGSTDLLRVTQTVNAAYPTQLATASVYRDPNAWYHVLVAFDGTQTGFDRVKLYINGAQVSFTGNANSTTWWFQNQPINVGRHPSDYGYLVGYLAEYHFVDGQALSPTSFGEYDAQGIWVPKSYFGGHGTNGFYLDFADPNNIGTDRSGNGNNFTATGFDFADSASSGSYLSGSDQVSDSPTDNYFNYNPLNADFIGSRANAWAVWLNQGKKYSGVQQLGPSHNGKYAIIGVGSGGQTETRYTLYEFYATKPATQGSGTLFYVGWNETGSSNYYIQKLGSGVVQYSGVLSSTASAPQVGFVVVVDEPAGKYWLGYYMTDTPSNVTYVVGSNGATIAANPTANPDTGTSPTGTFTPGLNLYYDVRLQTSNTNSGAIIMPYQPHTDWVPQIPNIASFSYVNNTSLLKETPIPKSSDHFDVITDTGANILTAAQTKFPNGLWWIKDTVSGQNQFVSQIISGQQVTCPQQNNASAYVAPSNQSMAWCWATDAAGLNTTAGFQILTYTGDGTSSQTISHSLGVAPSAIWTVATTGGSSTRWNTYFDLPDMGPNKALDLRDTDTAKSGTTYWRNTAPTSTQFTVGQVNNQNKDFFALLWTAIPGYSAIGQYTGNGSNDGPFVYCGFKPAWLIVKVIGSGGTSSGQWSITDRVRNPTNVVDVVMETNSQNGNGGTGAVDFDYLSNGFKLRKGARNNNNAKYVYMAFAENPFGGSNVSPATAR